MLCRLLASCFFACGVRAVAAGAIGHLGQCPISKSQSKVKENHISMKRFLTKSINDSVYDLNKTAGLCGRRSSVDK